MLQHNSRFALHTHSLKLNEYYDFILIHEQIPEVGKNIIPKVHDNNLQIKNLRLGVSHATLFPDLDDIAKEIK
jgi:hypothetical protein